MAVQKGRELRRGT